MEKVGLAVGLLLIVLFTQATPERVERQIEHALRQALPARHVDVELDGAPGLPTLRGKFRKMTITVEGLSFRGGQLMEMLPVQFATKAEKEGRVGEIFVSLHDADYEGLRIATLNAHARTVRFDLKASLRLHRLVLVAASTGTMTGFIPLEALQRYLAAKAASEGVDDLQVTLGNGDAEVQGRWRVTVGDTVIGRLPFSATVQLFPANDNEVHWRLTQVRVAQILPLPADWLQERLKRFNPLMKFDLAPLQLTLHTVQVTPQGVSLAANFSLAPAKD
ncbi:hypothetical protein HRbin17_00868 [bacterium HR17]|jgi:hypothetical protein|uniref:DUF2993 domain-containing protein n=1 Tax=Candidatus Fervidibacter japonicus TaxID=2035412 RepID=A0A2H5XAZ5_9BACT|nr:hypothetical protein HRbin17_00868 [bacterium HR17]